jgi:hypothetical protein
MPVLSATGAGTVTLDTGSFLYVSSGAKASNPIKSSEMFNDGFPYTFDPLLAHSWTLLTAGLIVNQSGGYNPADFTVDFTSTFTYGETGSWSVSQVGNMLQLYFLPVSKPSTWILIQAARLCLGSLLGGGFPRASSSRDGI